MYLSHTSLPGNPTTLILVGSVSKTMMPYLSIYLSVCLLKGIFLKEPSCSAIKCMPPFDKKHRDPQQEEHHCLKLLQATPKAIGSRYFWGPCKLYPARRPEYTCIVCLAPRYLCGKDVKGNVYHIGGLHEAYGPKPPKAVQSLRPLFVIHFCSR